MHARQTEPQHIEVATVQALALDAGSSKNTECIRSRVTNAVAADNFAHRGHGWALTNMIPEFVKHTWI